MKLLYISEAKEEAQLVVNIIKSQFKNIHIIIEDEITKIMQYAAHDGPFGFFLLDANLRLNDPNALALNLLEFTGDRPILFIGHEANILTRISQELYQRNDYNDKIYKPIDRADFPIELREKIQKIILWAKEEEFEQSLEDINPNEYIGMKLKTFYLYQNFPYDLYLSITQTQYIKIISANKPYNISTLVNYAKKNVKFLYIKKDDQIKFLEDEVLKCQKGLTLLSPGHKDIYLIYIRSFTVIHQYIHALGVTNTIHDIIPILLNSIIQHYKLKVSIQEILQTYPMFYEGIPSKGLLTAFFSLALSQKLNWESETTQSKLVLCALLQDLYLQDESFAKVQSMEAVNLDGFNEDERKNILNHPIKAAELSKQFGQYPDIDFILSMHHELPNRKGFPNSPPTLKLTQICAVFNCSQYIASVIDGTEISDDFLLKTYKSMLQEYDIGSFREIIKHLRSILKIPTVLK